MFIFRPKYFHYHKKKLNVSSVFPFFHTITLNIWNWATRKSILRHYRTAYIRSLDKKFQIMLSRHFFKLFIDSKALKWRSHDPPCLLWWPKISEIINWNSHCDPWFIGNSRIILNLKILDLFIHRFLHNI